MGYSLNKIGMTRPTYDHQRYMRNIMLNYYSESVFDRFECIQEANCNEDDQDGYIPDLQFKDYDMNTAVCIEIETSKRKKRATDKLKYYFEEYNVAEVFIALYDTDVWTRYTIDEDGNIYEEQTTYSQVLDFDFQEAWLLPGKKN